MNMFEANTPAKATEVATTRQQKINMFQKKGDNQKTQSMYG